MELLERLHLDLPDALAREADFLPDLLQRQRFLALEAEAQAQHAGIALVDRVEELEDRGEILLALDVLLGRRGARVLEHVAEVRILAVALDGRLAGRVVRLDGAAHDQELLDRQAHLRRQLLDGGLAAEAFLELAVGLLPARDQLHHVGGDVDRLDGVDERALDGLLDPPARVGAEAGALGGVEALDGLDEADVAFLDQVGERQAPVRVVLGDGDHQAQVRLDHPLLGFGALIVDDAPTQRLLLVRGEKTLLLDFSEVELKFVLHTGSRHTPSRSADQFPSHTLEPGPASYATHRQTQGFALAQPYLNVKLISEEAPHGERRTGQPW